MTDNPEIMPRTQQPDKPLLFVAFPNMSLLDFTGPQKLPLYQLVDQVLRAKQDGRVVIKDEQASYFGVRINDRSLTPDDDARIGALTLDQWLAAAAVPA